MVFNSIRPAQPLPADLADLGAANATEPNLVQRLATETANNMGQRQAWSSQFCSIPILFRVPDVIGVVETANYDQALFLEL